MNATNHETQVQADLTLPGDSIHHFLRECLDDSIFRNITIGIPNSAVQTANTKTISMVLNRPDHPADEASAPLLRQKGELKPHVRFSTPNPLYTVERFCGGGREVRRGEFEHGKASILETRRPARAFICPEAPRRHRGVDRQLYL